MSVVNHQRHGCFETVPRFELPPSLSHPRFDPIHDNGNDKFEPQIFSQNYFYRNLLRQWIFFRNFDFKNGCKNHFRDNNEKNIQLVQALFVRKKFICHKIYLCDKLYLGDKVTIFCQNFKIYALWQKNLCDTIFLCDKIFLQYIESHENFNSTKCFNVTKYFYETKLSFCDKIYFNGTKYCN